MRMMRDGVRIKAFEECIIGTFDFLCLPEELVGPWDGTKVEFWRHSK
jgi:hypothetical protein